MAHAKRDDELRGLLLYGDGWDNPEVRQRLAFHLAFMRNNPDEQFVISLCRYWQITFYRRTDQPETIYVSLAKPAGEAYYDAAPAPDDPDETEV